MALTELDAFLSHPSHRGTHGMDVMEVWGGKGGVSKISIRKCLNTGHNFDLVTGADLTKYHNQQMLLKYVRTHQPLVVVMGPPCTAFGNWSHTNQYNAPDAYAASRVTGVTLARLAARIASVQPTQNRHFIFENPRGSEMFKPLPFEHCGTLVAYMRSNSHSVPQDSNLLKVHLYRSSRPCGHPTQHCYGTWKGSRAHTSSMETLLAHIKGKTDQG